MAHFLKAKANPFGDSPPRFHQIIKAIVAQCPEVLEYDERDKMDRPSKTITIGNIKLVIADEDCECDYLRLNVLNEDKSYSLGIICWDYPRE